MMMRAFTLVVINLLLLLFSPLSIYANERLLIFIGAAFKKPMDEAIEEFKKEKNVDVDVIYGGVVNLLSQIILGKQGDLLIVPSPDIMNKAIKKGLVKEESVKNFLYFVPCINVWKGNPKNIKGLKDLTRPGLKIAIANPETVYIGSLAVEIIEKNLNAQEKEALRKNIVTYAENLDKLATLLILKQVDAIIGFTHLEGWYPDKIQNIRFKPNEIVRIGNGQIGILTFIKNQKLANELINFLTSERGLKVFKKYHYITSLDEAYAQIGEKKPVGGEYVVPKEWIKK